MNKFDDLPEPTKHFLTGLSREDIATLESGLPIIRAIMGFGKVTKWLAITAIGVIGGIVMLGDSIGKILGWFNR